MSTGTIRIGARPPGVDAISASMENLAVEEGNALVGGDASLDTAPGRSIEHVTDLLSGFRISDDEHRGIVKVAGYHVPVTFVIDRKTYEADISFVYAAAQYTFRVTKWSRNGMRAFLNLFHEHEDLNLNPKP